MLMCYNRLQLDFNKLVVLQDTMDNMGFFPDSNGKFVIPADRIYDNFVIIGTPMPGQGLVATPQLTGTPAGAAAYVGR